MSYYADKMDITGKWACIVTREEETKKKKQKQRDFTWKWKNSGVCSKDIWDISISVCKEYLAILNKRK